MFPLMDVAQYLVCFLDLKNLHTINQYKSGLLDFKS